jgi:hypothetical protein
VRYFIGAKDLQGRVIVAEMIVAKDFYAALLELQLRAQSIAGAGPAPDGKPKFRITAVNEQLWENGRPAVAEFLEGAQS